MKLFRLALVSSSLVFALGTAQASDTAVINLSATVSPGSCEISASNDDLDLGSIAFSELQQAAPTLVPFEENTSITITCTALHQGVYFTVAGADGDLARPSLHVAAAPSLYPLHPLLAITQDLSFCG